MPGSTWEKILPGGYARECTRLHELTTDVRAPVLVVHLTSEETLMQDGPPAGSTTTSALLERQEHPNRPAPRLRAAESLVELFAWSDNWNQQAEIRELERQEAYERESLRRAHERQVRRSRLLLAGITVGCTLVLLGLWWGPVLFLTITGAVVLAFVVAFRRPAGRSWPRSSPSPSEKEKLVVSRNAERLRSAQHRADQIVQNYTSYLFDATAIIRRPALDDLGVEQTRMFVQAYYDLTSVDWSGGVEDLERFERMISETETAWRTADQNATRVASSYLTLEEQKRLQRSEQLLQTALSEAATSPERRLAFERALVLLQGLVDLPTSAREALEQKIQHALESTPEFRDDAPRSDR